MITQETEARIVRLYHAEKWPVGTLAQQLGVHHSVVRRVLSKQGLIQPARQRPSMLDPFVPFIRQTLEKYPSLRASRLYEMVRQRGYPGRPDHFRHLIARYRPRPAAEAFLRLRTLPGEQAQVDWGHFGTLQVGQAQRPLVAFVMVLSWSRQIFVRFFLSQRMECFLRGHQEAFEVFGGVARVLLYDNLKSAVLERQGDAIRFHPTLLAFAAHYRYQPRPVAVARGNEKGRVERAISYVRQSFFAARQYTDLEDLNRQAQAWSQTLAAERRHPDDRTLNVAEAFAQERPKLLPLPDDAFESAVRVEVKVGKTPYVRFDSNDYSIPHTHVRRALTVLASHETVRILDGLTPIATHARSYSRDEQIEAPEHLEALTQAKRHAKEHRGMDRLYHAAPQSRDLLIVLAERGGNLGAATRQLLRLLDSYGAEALDTAIGEALGAQAFHVAAVRLVLERRWHQQQLPPPLPFAWPADPRVQHVVIKPHALTTYDVSTEDEDDTDNT